MKIWLPYVQAGSGSDVYVEALAGVLADAGQEVVLSPLARTWQFAPWPLRLLEAPPETDVILASTGNGFAFRRRGCKLVVVEFHCVLDAAYAPYRSRLQALYHETLMRIFERASLKAADALVAISANTARSISAALGGPRAEIISTGIDTGFFCPPPDGMAPDRQRPVELLFVGNLIRRKGADLLPEIMRKLGPGFELHYTSGLRSKDPYSDVPNMKPLGRLTREALRDAYRRADILLFPTRFEGFGYAAAEAMACGTPVVTSACSSLPELVEDGVTGRLCPVDDTDAFVTAVRGLAENPDELRAMGQRARAAAVATFSLASWVEGYLRLFNRLVEAR